MGFRPGQQRSHLGVSQEATNYTAQRTPPRLHLLIKEALMLLQKNAIEKVPAHQKQLGFYTRFFLIRKKSGEWRPILDLRNLNKFLKKPGFRMVTLSDILGCLNKGDFMASLDMEDAYFHIPIHPKHRKYLRFTVAGAHYQFKVLPFGLKSAPRIFTKCLAPVAATL